MVRMSDILKRAKEKEREAKEERQNKPLIAPLRQEVPPEPIRDLMKEVSTPEAKVEEVKEPWLEQQPEIKGPEKAKAEISEVRISPLIMKAAKVASSEEILKLYEEMVSLMREILRKNIDYGSLDTKRITTYVEKIIEQLTLGNEELLMSAYIRESKDENYLLCHTVNVCIYSIEVGLGFGYEKSKLIELGISALLHDIGMPDYLHLSNQPRKLTAGEYDEIKNHPITGSKILEKLRNLNKVVICVVQQQHERIDGTGYPRGLKEESIHEYARILGLVDTFEAMLHPRPYRDEFLPSEGIREILTHKKAFTQKIIKILFERIGIFPPGSPVELNTKEIVRVSRPNRKVFLRPVVKIIYDADGEESKEKRMLDLTAYPNIYIKKSLRKNELKTFV